MRTRSRSGSRVSSARMPSRSSGVGTRLPGRVTAAAPHVTPVMRASAGSRPVDRPWSRPASMQSPAPTVDRGAVIAARACAVAPSVTSRAPSPPRLTATTSMPPATSSRAASRTWPSVGRSWSTSSASSSWLGLMRCGLAATAAANGAPEESMATRPPRSRTRLTRTAYRSAGAPGGRLPQPTTQSAPARAVERRGEERLDLGGDRSGPGSLSFVVVPSGSRTLMFMRTEPRTGTGAWSTPAASSSSSRRWPSGPPLGRTAVVEPPWAASARETLTPLPPGSIRLLRARCTSPRRSASMRTARSMLGLGVSVTIMRSPLPVRPHGARRRRRRRGRCR